MQAQTQTETFQSKLESAMILTMQSLTQMKLRRLENRLTLRIRQLEKQLQNGSLAGQSASAT